MTVPQNRSMFIAKNMRLISQATGQKNYLRKQESHLLGGYRGSGPAINAKECKHYHYIPARTTRYQISLTHAYIKGPFSIQFDITKDKTFTYFPY